MARCPKTAAEAFKRLDRRLSKEEKQQLAEAENLSTSISVLVCGSETIGFILANERTLSLFSRISPSCLCE